MSDNHSGELEIFVNNYDAVWIHEGNAWDANAPEMVC